MTIELVTVQLLLRDGHTILIDEDDLERVQLQTWHVRRTSTNYIYICNSAERGLGRYILNAPRGTIVDHINRDGLDNRKRNLRFVTPSQSARNAEHSMQYGYRGIYPAYKHGMWRARIMVNGRAIYLGSKFPTKILAAQAYDQAARELHGEFAVLNFP